MFEVVVFSQVANPLARAAPPVARWLQRRTANRYLLGLKAFTD